MSDSFDIVCSDGESIRGRLICLGHNGKNIPAIDLPDNPVLCYDDMNAILRKLAELSEDYIDGEDYGLEIHEDGILIHMNGKFSERSLELRLECLRKAKYQNKKALTPEEKIEKALTFLKDESWNPNSSHITNAIKIMES